MIYKTCRSCKTKKQLSEFYSKKESKDKLTYECKTCYLIKIKKYRESNPEKIKKTNKDQYLKNREHRLNIQKEWAKNNQDKIKSAKINRLIKNPEYNRKYTLKKYGVSEQDFNRMWIGQAGSCWTCSVFFNKKSDAKIDHCHKSSIVRGLLCSNCNTALGLVKENITTLKIMIDYLKNNKDGWKEF